MSTDLPIVSIGHVQRMAQEAFMRGDCLRANPFPFNSAAYQTWRDEFLRLERADAVRVPA
jgi:hypothetical protein